MDVNNDNVDGWKVILEFAEISKDCNIPKKVIIGWESIDSFINIYKEYLIKKHVLLDDEEINSIINYFMLHYPGTLMYILKKNVPSEYDIQIIQFSARQISHKTANDVLEIYRNRKEL